MGFVADEEVTALRFRRKAFHVHPKRLEYTRHNLLKWLRSGYLVRDHEDIIGARDMKKLANGELYTLLVRCCVNQRPSRGEQKDLWM